jgi:hypothetical protein
MVDYQSARFRGKFRDPWDVAVKKNNDGIKNGGKQ